MVKSVFGTLAFVIVLVIALLTSVSLEAHPQPEPSSGATPAQSADKSSPLPFKIPDATITPLGFMDLTNTWRSTTTGTSLQTNFGSIRYGYTPQGRVIEDNFSVAKSFIGFRVDTKIKDVNVLGYYESGFVGGIANAAFNTQVSSNSLIYRIRLYWVDLRRNSFEFLAGQSWSMITPNRKQISPIPADVFYPKSSCEPSFFVLGFPSFCLLVWCNRIRIVSA